jgi:iron complex outermembrane recepter protein
MQEITEFRLLNRGGWRRGLLALMAGGVAGMAGAETAPLAEDGYLGELPVVLSVTRLAQSLADTPGAVTVIDRDLIRRSGARTVFELLRFVPGFMVSGWNGANPIAQYHTRFDESGPPRVQVFIDGRSMYSSLYMGDTHRGMAMVVMEDIERIEVLRGPNSAAYGANAFLGVINIITRNSADARGTLVSITQGSGGISDQTLRHGWGNDAASFRITAARRSDDGYKMQRAYPAYYPTASDDTSLTQVHFRGDLRLSPRDELQLQSGGANHRADDGSSTLGNAPYTTANETAYLSARWTRQLSANESISLSATFDDERFDSRKVEFIGYPVMVDQSGSSQRTQVEFSHTQQPLDALRTVWGLTWRREAAESQPLFNDSRTFSQTQTRLFGNLEWRMAPQLLLNAGGLIEDNSIVGSSMTPRVMLNWQPLPEHTFRIGASKATRTPSLFELYGNNPIYDPVTGALLSWEIRASGKLRPERVYSQEIGWLGDFREYGLTVDVRVFKEQMRNMIRAWGPDPNDYVGNLDAENKGLEYQLQWRPQAGTRLLFAQSGARIRSEQPDFVLGTPHRIYSAAWFQNLPDNWEMGVMYAHTATMSWRGYRERIPAYGTTTLRLARQFRLAGARSEVALTVQSIEGDHYEFITPRPSDVGDPGSGAPVVPLVPRRAFLTVRTEF